MTAILSATGQIIETNAVLINLGARMDITVGGRTFRDERVGITFSSEDLIRMGLDRKINGQPVELKIVLKD